MFKSPTIRRLAVFLERKTMLIGGKISSHATKGNNNSDNASLAHIVATFTIILPISAFLYWRLFFEEFKIDYFETYFDINDVYYILYYKATTLLYITLLLSIIIPAALMSLKSWRYILPVTGVLIIYAIVLVFTNQTHFAWYQCVGYSTITIVIAILFLFYGRKALYGYIVLLSLFLVTSAKTDADYSKNVRIRKDILLKDNTFFMKKKDKTKYYVTSTSRFVVIYEIDSNRLVRVERDDIKY